MLRRRVMEESKQGSQYPFYSDYPTITEYGLYLFDSQSISTSNCNTFIKMDGTSYDWCGGGPLNMDFAVEYTKEKIIVYSNTVMSNVWIIKEQESSSFSLKRCFGTEKDPALVTFKIDKVS